MSSLTYRNDIDGLRAIAVISVLLFHLDISPNAYLGVDIFFAISGFLITKIIYTESIQGKFSIRGFYIRRIRRIFPLVLFAGLTSLFVGAFLMLPNDLENLAHSVIATNFFSNNILEKITAKNYWAGSNHYDPLMHTWSLGIEEQFYMIYPFLFILLTKRRKYILEGAIILITVISFLLFLTNENENQRFYFIPYRFFELSLGGIVAIYSEKLKLDSAIKLSFLLFLILILAWPSPLYAEITSSVVLLASAFLLMSSSKTNKYYDWAVANPVMLYIGKISFSIYMWHQIVFAFARYSYVEKINLQITAYVVIITISLSVISYTWIEQPFRKLNSINNRKLITYISLLYVISLSSAFFIVRIGGIVRDIPELNFSKSERWSNGIFNKKLTEKHIDYNKRIHSFDKHFNTKQQQKVLVFGNSFARDWANILLESKYKTQIELSYTEKKFDDFRFREKVKTADIIFTADPKIDSLVKFINIYNIDSNKLWIVGPKRFGIHNGLYYNKRSDPDYLKQVVEIDKNEIEINSFLRTRFSKKFIDIITSLKNENGLIPIFTDNGKFISQDCIHLTEDGAKFLAKKINLDSLFSKNVK